MSGFVSRSHFGIELGGLAVHRRGIRANAAAGGLTFERVCNGFAAIGTADQVVERIGELARDTGAGHVLAWMNIGSVAHDHIKESMQRFAEDALAAVREI